VERKCEKVRERLFFLERKKNTSSLTRKRRTILGRRSSLSGNAQKRKKKKKRRSRRGCGGYGAFEARAEQDIWTDMDGIGGASQGYFCIACAFEIE